MDDWSRRVKDKEANSEEYELLTQKGELIKTPSN